MDHEAENDRAPRARGRTGGMLALRAAVSFALVVYLVSTVDLRQIAAALPSIVWPLWLAALGLLLVSQVVSSQRWAMLARAVGLHRTRGHFLRLYFQGMFFNLCLPGAIGGDAVKALRLGRDGSQRALAGCTVLADRAGGLGALLLIGGAALAMPVLESQGLPEMAALAVVASLALAGLVAGIVVWRIGFDLLRKTPRVGSWLARLEPYRRDTGVLVRACAYSVLIQAMSVLVVWCLGLALQLEVPLRVCCVAVPAAAVLAMLPVSISGMGVRETALAATLARYGLDVTAGATLGVVWFSVIAAAGLIGGLVHLAEAKVMA
jgi:uncharacterized membrane protein YbhN (UPF0104 family)